MFNLSIMQFMLRQISDLAAEQQAQLFCQETYKEQTEDQSITSKQTVFPDIKLKQRSISGKFYPVNSQASLSDFYNALYTGNANYQAFLAGANCQGAAPTIYPALTNSIYDGNFVTPANFGIPYLDPDFMQKAFQWNVAMLFGAPDKNNMTISGGVTAYSGYEVENSDSVGQKAYINYNGYRIYVGGNTNTKITNISYTIYNTQDENEKKAFENVTNISPENLRNLRGQSGGYEDSMQLITQGYDGQIYLQYLTVVKIDYTVEIGYQGVTPMKNMIEFIQNYRVRGLDDSAPSATSQQFNEDATDVLEGTCYYWMVA